MVDGTTNTGIIETIQNVVGPVVTLVNGILTAIIPGKEEIAVIVVAAYLGWKWKEREYVVGGWDLWFKASIIIYILFKLVGFGVKII